MELVKFAYRLVKDCQAAKGEWIQVGRVVYEMQATVQLVQALIDDPTSIINKKDNKGLSIRKTLGIHISNCKQVLREVSSSLKKYNNMSVVDRIAWVFSGRGEIETLMSNLFSFATQLDTFINTISLMGIGRIEQLLENNGGNTKAAVKKVMQDVKGTGSSPQHSQRYETVLDEYAQDFERRRVSEVQINKDTDRGGKKSANALVVPQENKRAKSADSLNKNHNAPNGRASAKPSKGRKWKPTLECWLIQVKSGDAMFVKWQFSEKALQPRGQCKLEQMSKQFRASKDSQLKAHHELVQWVIEDRQKNESDSKYLWRPHAAKIEQKGTVLLNMGVEEQAMVIIKRGLTPEERAKEKAREQKAKAKQEANKRKAKAKARNNVEKAKEAAVKDTKKKSKKNQKAEQEMFQRKAEIEELRQEVERLKFAQKQSSGNEPDGSTGMDEQSSKGASLRP